MKKIYLSLVLAAFVSACTDSGLELDDYHRQNESTVKDQGGTYTEREISVSRNGTAAGQVTLRYYDDMPHVPYITAEAFYHLMMPSAPMTTEKVGDTYQLKTADGMLTVDVLKDVATSTSFSNFVGLQNLYAPGNPSFDTCYSPFIRYYSHENTPSTEPQVNLNFGKYGIDLHDDGKNVYFPLTTINDLFTDTNGMMTCFDGNQLMINTAIEKELRESYPDFCAPAFRMIEVDEDVARMRYSELCLVVDYFFGYPGRTILEKQGLKQNGLDATLDKISGGEQVKAMLKSPNQAKFVCGMGVLDCLLYDGGHTQMDTERYIAKSVKEEFEARHQEAYNNIPGQIKNLVNDIAASINESRKARNLQETMQQQAWGTNNYLTSRDGKTAVVVLKMFADPNYNGWLKYYGNGFKAEDWQALVENTKDVDILAQTVEALKRAKREGVKNLVLDVSTNPGGQDDPTTAVVALIGDKTGAVRPLRMAPSWELNTLTGQYRTKTFVIDRNFDGKFDDKDNETDYVGDMNIVVLTSEASFSNGNVFAAKMKDYGYQTWGRTSGGGACSVINYVTPDGMMYKMSSYRSHSTDKNYKSIDSGIPVDKTLTDAQMYDIEYLAGEFNK